MFRLVFIRKKKIQNKEYAYIVENRWKKRVSKGSKKGARQKVKGYLGRVHRPEARQDVNFFSHFSIANVEDYIANNEKITIIKDLVRFELIRHGFEEAGKLLSNEDIFFDLDSNEFFAKDNKAKKIVLELNEGFMCKETIENLLNLKVRGGEDAGYKLANAFVEAGIAVPKEVFVGFFSKVFK
ncbi:hypothetical protein J4209_04255 [Candidatus Woesearchaeota archaeon]|nr:hypothetical protein [Candidatus Woesearchaeota archaeon]